MTTQDENHRDLGPAHAWLPARPLLAGALFFAACAGPPATGASATDGPPGTSTTGTMPGEDPASSSGTGADTPTPTTSGPAPTTGDDPTSTGVDTSTGASAGPTCGDGHVDPGETCDWSADHNWDHGGCTSQCALARCGDGLLFQGVEACDEGEENAVGYAKCDPVTCQFGPRCGDGVRDPQEECDGGGPDGAGEVGGATAPCKAGCAWDGRVIFISSAAYDGDLGGITGADLKCQVLAQAQQIHDHERFRAWLSDADESPLSRLSFGPERLVMPNGMQVANNLAALITDGPGDGITVTEARDSIIERKVWTNTAVTGERFSKTDHCAGWTTGDKLKGARQGRNAEPELPPEPWEAWKLEKRWTSFEMAPCSKLAHLYCIED